MTLSDHIGETNSIISTGYADVDLVFIPSIFSDMMDKLLKMLYIAIWLTNSTQYFLGHFYIRQYSRDPYDSDGTVQARYNALKIQHFVLELFHHLALQ